MKAHYDEYQLEVRRRTAFRALMGAFALVLANGLACTLHPWAPPMMQAVILVALPTMYFVTSTMRRGAYLSRRERHPLASGGLLLAMGAVFGALSAARLCQGAAIVWGGQLTGEALPLFMAVFFLYLGGLVLLCALREGRAREE
jgi:hypothetical protein